MSTVQTPNWRQVELGRVVLFNKGTYAGKLATIVEIIDHKHVLVDGPKTGVPRHGANLHHLTLTQLVIPKITRGAKAATVAKQWAANETDAKWEATSWAKTIARRARRAQLTDFERFQVLVLKKQRRHAIRKAVAKA